MNSTEKALNKFFLKEANKLEKEQRGSSRGRNKSPEKTVVKEILSACRSIGFNLDVIEASGYDRMKKAMVHDSKVTPGYSDISGNSNLGLAVYIEAKAPGKRASLRDAQRAFLENKIKSGAFACVADSAEYVLKLYNEWLRLKLWSRELSILRPINSFQAKKGCPTSLLIDSLPKPKKKKNSTRSEKSDLDIFLD